MAKLSKPTPWHRPKALLTQERAVLNRRHFLAQLGLAASTTFTACSRNHPDPSSGLPIINHQYPAPRNPDFNPGWHLTHQQTAANHNNFYEFSTLKDQVRPLVASLELSPWPVEISGLVEKPLHLDATELIDLFPLEERVYRFRCVEAWAMIVPWSGFPLKQLIEKVSPKPEARFVRFHTFDRPAEAPGRRLIPQAPWPYTEGLRLDEALHPLTLLATGIYGHPLPKQHGAPLRLVVPWKYGYKSIKSIVKIELVQDQPKTFWETLLPKEYPFESNVNPTLPHPRWSQATERLIDTGDRVRTLLFNGYAQAVAHLY